MTDARNSAQLVPRREWPRVSVIIVNWNRKDDILWNLSYLAKQDYPELELIVVDNGSEDDSVEVLSQREDVIVVGLDKNYGPSKARNVGMEKATGRYALFLDSDAVASKHAIKRLVDRMEREPDIGVIGGRVINWYSRRIDQWIYPQPYEIYGRRPFDTYAFSAALAMVRVDRFREVGGFWEDLFIYLEEVDLSIRFLKAGYRVVYEPGARCFHKVSPEGRQQGGFYFYYSIRNWIWLFYRYYPPVERTRNVLTYLGVYTIKGLASRQLKACLKGMWDGLRQVQIMHDFRGERLTEAQFHEWARLNRRRRLKLGRD